MSLSDEDKALFRQAMHDVKPLKSNNTSKHQVPTKLKTKTIINKEIKDIPKGLEEDQYAPQAEPEAPLFYARSGINSKQLKALKKGHVDIERSVDLHSFTVDMAHDHLERVLQQPNRVIKIIHGKGQHAILKNQVNRWLRAHPRVLAFCSTPPRMGGTGALLVILKRNL